VPALSGAAQRFRGDDGSADPQVATALAAFAAGTGSEHAALVSLAGPRLLVPLVTMLAASDPVTGGEKTSEVALPTLVGTDGRRAIPAFTSLAALTRWRPGARPVPTDARLVWRAAVEDSCAVVIDVAGPVPLAVEGARLAALARGDAVPLPHQDPDVLDAVAAVAAAQPAVSRFRLSPGDGGGDLVIQLTLSAGGDEASAADLVALVGAGVLERLGGRLRRGVAIAVVPAAGDRPG
jgi:SseB protein N-terminal domain